MERAQDKTLQPTHPHQPIAQQNENRSPDCVYLDASLEKAQEEYTLLVTLLFNYQRVKIPGGDLHFGIRGGDLRLQLTHCHVSEWLVTSDFSWYVDKTTKIEKRHRHTENHFTTRDSSLSGTKPTLSAAYKKQSEHSTSDGLGDESRHQSWQVSLLLGELPGWRFRLKTGEDYLDGNIIDERFATVKISNGGQICLQFATEPKHIFTEITSGYAWKQGERNILNLKLANLYLWKFVIKPMINPYMSQVFLRNT